MELSTNQRGLPTSKTGLGGISLHVIIGLVLMFGISFLPAPAPLTPIGLKVLGLFVGIVYLWTFVGLEWPSILGITAASFYINSILAPTATAPFGIWRAIQESIGNWVVGYLIAALLLTHALNQAGFTKRITIWFMTRDFAKKNPWTFTYAFLGTCLFVGLWLDATVTLVFFLAIAYQMFEKLGYKKGDKYPLMIVIGLTFAVNLAFAMTPISHTITLIGMGVYSGVTNGGNINFIEYMAVGIPVGLVAFVIMLMFFRYVVNPDVGNFKNVNYDTLIGEMPGPMKLREKAIVAIFGLVTIAWLAPGFLDLLAPTAAITKYFHDMTIIIPTFLGVIVMLILKVDGKPLLDWDDAFQNAMPWGVITLITCAMLYGTILTEKPTGINDFIVAKIMPILGNGYSSYILMAILIALIVVATNVLNNVPITILFVAVCVPLASKIGLDPKVIGILVILSAQWGFALPSALATVAWTFGNDWAQPRKVFLYGVTVMLACIFATVVVGYPLANFFS